MAGDERTGVSVMRVTEGLDSGPVAMREEVGIGPDEDFGELSERLAELGGRMIVRALDLQAEGGLSLEDQDDGAATYAEKIERAERRLDLSRPAEDLARAVRALTPHVGAYIETVGGGRLGVRRARAVGSGPPAGTASGDGGELLVGCGEGALRLEVVQPEGSRPMEVDAFLRGHPVPDL
jgi:methionyl-tRNA formyltransferase